MIQCEHFLYGQLNGVGYRLIKTQGIDEILRNDSLRYLCQLDSTSIIQTWLPKEQHVAITYIGNTYDEYERHNLWNHTILIPIQDYFKLNPPDKFADKFITEKMPVPTKLAPIKIEEHP